MGGKLPRLDSNLTTGLFMSNDSNEDLLCAWEIKEKLAIMHLRVRTRVSLFVLCVS